MAERKEKSRLQLTEERRMIIFHALGSQVGHCEALAAIDFHYTFVDPKSFASRATVAQELKQMKLAHDLRVELVPCVFPETC